MQHTIYWLEPWTQHDLEMSRLHTYAQHYLSNLFFLVRAGSSRSDCWGDVWMFGTDIGTWTFSTTFLQLDTSFANGFCLLGVWGLNGLLPKLNFFVLAIEKQRSMGVYHINIHVGVQMYSFIFYYSNISASLYQQDDCVRWAINGVPNMYQDIMASLSTWRLLSWITIYA